MLNQPALGGGSFAASRRGNRTPYPRISIVTPSYNQKSFLEATIRSVLQQDYPNLEYMVIDGGSTDGSLEVIKQYEARLQFWCSEPDAGQYEAINKGFSHATGEIMAWLNSDDLYCPWTLKAVASILSAFPQVEWLTSLSPGWCDQQGAYLEFDSVVGFSKDAFLDGCYLPTGASAKTALTRSPRPIQQESCFWRRSLWNKIGGKISTEVSLAGDFDLWARFYQHAELYGTPVPLGIFRLQPNQRSRNQEQYLREAEASLAAFRAKCGWSPNLLRCWSYRWQVDRIPKLRSWIGRTWVYSGQRIVKRNVGSADSTWEIEQYRFK